MCAKALSCCFSLSIEVSPGETTCTPLCSPVLWWPTPTQTGSLAGSQGAAGRADAVFNARLLALSPRIHASCARALHSLWATESALARIRLLRLHTPGTWFSVCMKEWYSFVSQVNTHSEYYVPYWTNAVRVCIKKGSTHFSKSRVNVLHDVWWWWCWEHVAYLSEVVFLI